MRKSRLLNLALAVMSLSCVSVAQAPGTTKPELVLEELVRGMPKGDAQDIRIMTASFKPGDRTVFHTHRIPVAVNILQGAYTLELEGRQPKTVKAGEGFVEPPKIRMIGYNRSATEPLGLVIFYVSDPNTPFLDPIH